MVGISAVCASVTVAAPAPQCPTIGPDVIVGDLWDIDNSFTPQSGMDAFSMGTYSCNIGDDLLKWYAFINQHPVIAQSAYVRKQVNGSWRFEQIGQSWLKHGFYALQHPLCCPTCTPAPGTPGEHLGVGCADPYTAARNAGQGSLGPKREINAHTGEYPFPATNPPFSGNGRLMQIALSDLAPSSATVQYFGEGQYVSPDDAFAGNQNNNASYRLLTVTGGPTDYSFALAGTTQRAQPALRAWKDTDPTVTEIDIQVPGDGLLILAYQVTDLGNGWWHYEYAVQNLNSDRCANSFSIPVPGCVQLQNIGFHDVAYRDGDGYFTSDTTPSNFEGTDWAAVRGATTLTWSTPGYDANPNANALRWGTTYNFRFDANASGTGATATLGLYKSGTPASMQASVKGPSGSNPPACLADVAGGNNIVDVSDLLLVINTWATNGAGDCAPPPCGDDTVNVIDLLAVINAWGPCP